MAIRRSGSCICVALLFLSFNTLLPAQPVNPSLYSEMRWRCIGPFRGGRTVASTGVPTEPNIFYVAAVNGGIWKSTDYGQVWTPIFDGQPTGSVGALAVAPSNPNILYAGSGEGLQRPDLAVGDGVYKSIDAGATWRHLGLRDGRQIASILVDPKDPNRLYVAVLGHPYGANEERGVYRSTDGGQSFEKILYKDENTGAIDLAFDPTNSRTIYAVLWAARQAPWEYGNAYIAPGSGLFKSTDGGNTWRPLTQGLPSVNDKLGRIGIGIAPNDPARMYALVDAPKLGGLYRSDDAGESWRRVNTQERIWGRGSDFANVRVDPGNKDMVYVANTSTYRSTDGGENFTAIKGAPGGDDYHTIWINPSNSRIILIGSDQGATISVNGGQTWSSWYNQPTAQFFHVITDNRFPYWIYGAQQESGSVGIASRSDYGAITFRDWHPVGVEEYGYVAPDPLDPNMIYGGKVTRFNQTTGHLQDVSPHVLRTEKFRYNRTAPLIFSPVDPHTLFFAAQMLFKTSNGGESWSTISPDLTRETPGVPANLGRMADEDHAGHRGVIYSIGPSFKDVNLIWVGTDDGLIHVTRDGGKSWQNVTPPEVTAWTKISQIEASHYDVTTAYASATRFRLDDLHPYIYRTHDGGKSWTKVVNGLPDNEPVNVVREDPVKKGLLFAGTEGSIYFSVDDGDNWQSLRLNIPATSMRDLVIHKDDLVVGTHGRSFWVLDNITPLRQMSSRRAPAAAFLFRPQLTYRMRRDQNTDTPLPPEIPAGKNPPDGATIDYFLPDASGEVTLEISDASGKLVRRYASADKPDAVKESELNVPTYWVRPPQTVSAAQGMHRFLWDLRYPPPDSLDHEYPISAIYGDTPREPLGILVLPGEYHVKLTVAGRSVTEPITVRLDERLKVPQAALIQQFELESKLVEGLHENLTAIQRIRALREQLQRLQKSGEKQGERSAVADSIAALEQKASTLEGGERRRGMGSSVAAGDSLVQLNGWFSSLYRALEDGDAAPTTQQLAVFADLQKSLRAQLLGWKEIEGKDIPALNEQLRQNNLPPLDANASVQGNYDGLAGTTDEE